MTTDTPLPYVKPPFTSIQETYERRLPIGLKAAGWFIQKWFRDRNINFPEQRWIQNELSYPAFHHLAFAYKNNIYSVLFEFVRHDGNYILQRDINNQLRECKNNDLIACTIPLDYDTYEPIIGGNHLISTDKRLPITFEDRIGKIPMSKWEVNNFGISIVKNELLKQGYRILSFSDVLGIEPNIWFEDDKGRRNYVIVKTISGNTQEWTSYKLNQQLLLKFIEFDGFYAEVGVSPSASIAYDKNGDIVPLSKRFSMVEPKEILFRDSEFYISYKGLRNIERKAAESGVTDKILFTIREQ